MDQLNIIVLVIILILGIFIGITLQKNFLSKDINGIENVFPINNLVSDTIDKKVDFKGMSANADTFVNLKEINESIRKMNINEYAKERILQIVQSEIDYAERNVMMDLGKCVYEKMQKS